MEKYVSEMSMDELLLTVCKSDPEGPTTQEYLAYKSLLKMGYTEDDISRAVVAYHKEG